MKLTKSVIDKLSYSKANGKQDIYWDDNLSAFGVRVYPSGKKSFVLFYRSKGRQHIKVIGQYGPLTLEQARNLAKKDLAAVIDNKDPLDEKRKVRGGISFKEFCTVYMKRHAKEYKRTWVADQRRIDKYLVPAFGSLKIDSITRADVVNLYSDIVQQFPYEANRIIQQLSKMFERAKFWGYIKDEHFNITRGVRQFKEKKRDRWITVDELPRLAQAINEEKNFYGSNALWLYLLLGVRRDELLTAKWSDIDWHRQELKLPETKAGRVHYIPLSAPVLALLHELPKQKDNPYILPGDKPGGHLVNIEKIWRRVRKAAGVEDVRLHDLRRTLGSWLAQSGNSLHLIGRVLNHSSQSTTAIYARFAQDHVKQALEDHGKNLMTIAGKQAPVRVLSKTKRRRAK